MPRKRKARDLTYRKEQCDRRYVIDYATRLVGKRIVVQMSDGSGWRSAWLLKVYPDNDRFQVKWTKEDKGRKTIRGLWRVHNANLFTAGQKPRPQRLHGMVNHAKVSSTVKPNAQEGKMATTKSKTSAKRGPGRPKGSGGGGGIASLPESKRAAMAKKIAKLRTQKVKWDGPDGICAQVGISSALQGRELLREYGNEDMVRERAASNGGGSKKSTASKSKGKATPAKAKRKVTVKRGRGRAANPS